MSDRAAKVAEAQRLRADGLLYREIAAEMGCAIQTVHAYISDPDLSKLKARKDRYRGTCVDCGARTDGSNGADRAPDRCRKCKGIRERKMSRRWVIESFQEWEVGEVMGVSGSAVRERLITAGEPRRPARRNNHGEVVEWPSRPDVSLRPAA